MSELKALPDNLNYKVVPMNNGRYRLRKVPMNNVAGTSVTMQANSTTLVEWKIPANTVFNPARSSLDYMLTAPLQAAVSNWGFEDTFEICSAIQFCNASGVYLCDLQYANNYVSAARKVDTSMDDFLSGDYTSGLYKATKPHIATANAGANFFPPLFALAANNAYGLAAGAYDVAQTLIEPQYARAGAAGAAVVRARSIPFAAFTQTALGMDRDMIFPEDMYIRFTVAPASKCGYVATTDASPSAGAAAPAAVPTLTNLYLRLAVQVDREVEEVVRAKFLSDGLSYLIPFQYAWKNTTQAGTTSIQLTLNNQYGSRLKRIMHVPFEATEALNHAYDHDNVNGSKITSYQTFLDSIPLQDSKLSCLQPVAGGAIGMDDWRENRDLLRGSVLDNSLVYGMNWVHIDSFSQPKHGKVLTPTENILEGLDLSMPRIWTITADAAVALNQYSFATFIRQVTTSPLGTQVVVV